MYPEPGSNVAQAPTLPVARPGSGAPNSLEPKLSVQKSAPHKLPVQRATRRRPIQAVNLDTLAYLDDQIDAGVYGTPAELNIYQLSEQTGWSVDQLEKLWLWAGLPHQRSDALLYTHGDVEGLRDLKEFSEQEELDEEALGSLVRSLGSAMEQLALWQVEAMTQFVAKRRGLGDTAARIEAATFAPSRGRRMIGQISSLWLRHFTVAVRRLTTETVLQRGVSYDDQQFPLLRAVGFASIVDFADLTQDMSKLEYTNLVKDFHNITNDLVKLGGGRIIKHQGDEILFVADDINGGADIALQLANMQSNGFPGPVRVGLTWCKILTAYGNVFGPGVVTATHLARLAPSNSVYVSMDAAALLSRYPKYYSLEELEPAVIHAAEPEPITACHLRPA